MDWRLKEESELNQVVKEVLSELEKGKGDSASVLALHGDLGAGKTTFMQKLAKELGVVEVVTSPTFVIMKAYELHDKEWDNLVHIDAYRVEEVDEMRPLGFAEIVEQKENIVCIEWAENISNLLPENTLHLTIEIENEERKITLTNG